MSNVSVNGQITGVTVGTEGTLYGNADCLFGSNTLNVSKAGNSITSGTNASLSGLNEITCTKLNNTELNPPIAPSVPTAWSEYAAKRR